jgi:hypothetical protein
MMENAMSDLVLSAEEIVAITHRKRPVEQLRDLLALGIPATRRHDNTICVLRVDLVARQQAANAPEERPQRKSARQ